MDTFTRRLFHKAACATAASIAMPAIGRAQSVWPQRPVRIVIPFAAGGAADTLARILADHFRTVSNGHALVVENKPGAGGTVAAAEIAGSAPDGHSLLLGDIGANAVAQSLFANLSYDVQKSFRHVIHLANLPMVMIGHPSTGNGTVRQLIDLAKASPGKLNYASAGIGGASHLMMELFKKAAGVDIVHVPYRGGAPVLMATMNNEVQVSISTISTSKSFIEAGSVNPLGVGSASRLAVLPNVSPIAEFLPGFEALTWHGIHVAAGTPGPIVDAINQAFNTLLGKPEVLERLMKQTALPVGGTPAAYAAFVDRETRKWSDVVREAGIKAS